MSSCASISDPCSGSNPTSIPSGDPCLVTVPAVDFTGVNGNKPVAIEGFAQIYIDPEHDKAWFQHHRVLYKIG